MGFKASSESSFVYSFAFVSDLENEANQTKVTVNHEVEIVKKLRSKL